MTENKIIHHRALKIALGLIGIFFIVGLGPVMYLFPESWGWAPAQHEYEQMIQGIYATLGVFLLIAIKNPLQHKSVIWFAVWSSFVHSGIMFMQALQDKEEYPNFFGDVPALFIVACVLGFLMYRSKSAQTDK